MPILMSITKLRYVIVLCDDFPRMKAFYQELFGFPVQEAREDVVAFEVGELVLCLRKRTRDYDGSAANLGTPGVQLSFPVAHDEVDVGYRHLIDRGVQILDPPTTQSWGHYTVYFADPEGNVLELYAEGES